MKLNRTSFIALLTTLALARVAPAALLWTQPPDGQGFHGVSQVFPDLTTFDTKLFDDVVVDGAGWIVNKVTIYGDETGNMALNQGVFLRFSTEASFLAAGTTYSGVEDASGNLVFDNLNIPLEAGNYWISSWIRRNFFGAGGAWYWERRLPITGLQCYFHNPGGGFGHGTEPAEGHNLFMDFPRDLAFDIEGVYVPEPSMLGVIVLALPLARRARY